MMDSYVASTRYAICVSVNEGFRCLKLESWPGRFSSIFLQVVHVSASFCKLYVTHYNSAVSQLIIDILYI